MSADTNGNFIKVDVPPGFLPQSVPVKSSERISTSDIRLEKVTNDDLLTIARGVHHSFPEVWWQVHEPLHIRPSDSIREQRFAKRLEAFTLNPDTTDFIKAVDVTTGEIMGAAGWHLPIPPADFVHMFRVPLFARSGTRPQPGWSDADVEEMVSGILPDVFDAEFAMYDQARAEEMGDQQFWYLAPLFVFEKFRGRGVGGKLLEYAIEKAEAHSPPLAVVLEALPNARPVYMRYGFEPPENKEGKPHRESLMIRWPRGKTGGVGKRDMVKTT